MTIISSELKFYKSETVTNDSTNGGRMSTVEVISGVVNNVWPHVLKAERAAGSTLLRKLFAKNTNDNDEVFLSPAIWNHAPTDAEDWITAFAGTQRDAQGDLTGSERQYGSARLKNDIAAGDSTFTVIVEDDSITGIFQDGDTIHLTDMATPDASTGNEEELIIDGAPSVSGSEVTITVSTQIANDYAAADGKCSSVIPTGDLKCTFDNWAETTSTSATYDEGAHPPIMDNIGTIEQTWTLTFTDATHYTVSGDTVGTVGSGDIATDFIPSNPDYSKPYFTLEAAGFDGTDWAAADTIVFDTHPAAFPFWLKRVVPAGASSFANNKNTTVLSGESA